MEVNLHLTLRKIANRFIRRPPLLGCYLGRILEIKIYAGHIFNMILAFKHENRLSRSKTTLNWLKMIMAKSWSKDIWPHSVPI